MLFTWKCFVIDQYVCNDFTRKYSAIFHAMHNQAHCKNKSKYSGCYYTKVVVNSYLRSRNEFKLFLAKASDSLTRLVSQSEASFLARNSFNSFLDLRYKVTSTLSSIPATLTISKSSLRY